MKTIATQGRAAIDSRRNRFVRSAMEAIPAIPSAIRGIDYETPASFPGSSVWLPGVEDVGVPFARIAGALPKPQRCSSNRQTPH